MQVESQWTGGSNKQMASGKLVDRRSKQTNGILSDPPDKVGKRHSITIVSYMLHSVAKGDLMEVSIATAMRPTRRVKISFYRTVFPNHRIPVLMRDAKPLC